MPEVYEVLGVILLITLIVIRELIRGEDDDDV
jgi:hypothetical protein